MWVTLPVESYKSAEARAAFFDRLDERIGSSPAIASYALAASCRMAVGYSSR